MTKTVVVTGSSGQDGWYLIKLLIAGRNDVHAQSRQPQEAASRHEAVRWHIGDLAQPEFCDALVARLQPDEIYNLAGMSRPVQSWANPSEAMRANALIPLNLCEAVRKHCPAARLFQASSSEIFGDRTGGAQDETTPCSPTSPYAIAKLHAHHTIGAYRREYGLHLSSGIMFNHESPRRPLSYVSQKIAFGAAAISLGLTQSRDCDERGQPLLVNGKLHLGNLDVSRDFGFAGDYVEAMQAIVRNETPDDYVVGTGKSHSIAQFCERAFARVGRDWRDHIAVDDDLIRKTDSHYTQADPAKLFAACAWRPKTTFDALVALMVDAQIERLHDARRAVAGYSS